MISKIESVTNERVGAVRRLRRRVLEQELERDRIIGLENFP